MSHDTRARPIQETTMNEKNGVANGKETGKPSGNNTVKAPSRRKFLGQVGAALTGGALLGKAAFASANSDNSSFEDGIPVPDHGHNSRVQQCFQMRLRVARDEARIPTAPQTTNGDEERYRDKCGTYSRAFFRMASGW